MKRIATALVALALSGGAEACTDPREPSFLASLETGTSVFVFRVTSLRMIDRRADFNPNVISGPIEIVRTIKGTPPFKRVAYQDISCGGIQLIVGHYYIVTTRQSASVIAFVRGDNSVLDVSNEFDPLLQPKYFERGVTAAVENYLAGKPMNERVLNLLTWANLHNAPPPPPLQD